MIRTRHSLLLYGIVLILTIIPSPSPLHASFFEGIKAFFGKMPYKEITQKKYPLDMNGTLTLNNFDGNIKIVTHKYNLVHLTATKRANNPDMLNGLQVSEKVTTTPEGHHVALTISSVISGDTHAKIDYELAVPPGTALNVTTDLGTIHIDQVRAPAVLRTYSGSISVGTAYDSVTASIEKKGAISIDRALKSVRATTQYGNIVVKNAQDNVFATVYEKGCISVAYLHTAPTGETLLTTQAGTITLALPDRSHATIMGKAQRGNITSDHVITLSPLTTTLNKQAWARFRQEITGIIGKSEGSSHQIKLASEHGNIKIAKNSVK